MMKATALVIPMMVAVALVILATSGCASVSLSFQMRPDAARLREMIDDCASQQRGDRPRPTLLTALEAAEAATYYLASPYRRGKFPASEGIFPANEKVLHTSLQIGHIGLEPRGWMAPLTHEERALRVAECLRDKYALPMPI